MQCLHHRINDRWCIPSQIFPVQQAKFAFCAVVPDKASNAVCFGTLYIICVILCPYAGVVFVDCTEFIQQNGNALADESVFQILKIGVQFLLVGITAPVGTGILCSAEIPRSIAVNRNGNVCILRGGKEAIRSNTAVVAALRAGLEHCGAPGTLVNLVEDTSRASAAHLMEARGFVDLLIPRGGKGLIRACVDSAKVPCIETGTGICHIYVDAAADLQKALDIVYNAKTSRPSVCNAAEVCLVHRDVAEAFLPALAARLAGKQVELRLCPRSAAVIPGTPAGPEDFDTEFLDYILAVKVVDSVQDAAAHIAAHSTGHSEAIVTEDAAAADAFCAAVDSAAVYVNASTRFTDGGEFGLGCEMGISTQKLGARGPMGLAERTSYKYIIRGNGQVR